MFFIPGGGGFPGIAGGPGKGKGKGFPFPMGMPFGESDDEGGGEDRGHAKEVDNSNLYELLGVEKDASPAEIKKAYRLKAKEHHPDKGGDPEIFKDIQHAFEVLSDEEKRGTYDKFGEEGLSDDGPGSPQDLLSQLFGGGKGKGGGKGRGQRPRTETQTRPMWVTLEELYTGVTRKLPIMRKVIDASSASSTCQACDGEGMVVQVVSLMGGMMQQQMQRACPKCSGSGTTAKMKNEREALDVFVEKGSPDGHRIVCHGKADELPGHEPGDVVVVVKQQDHPRFMRKGADLYLERDITLAEALTGFKIVVPHLDSRRLVVRSKDGEVLRPQHGVVIKAVKGGGMPIHKDPFRFGNLFLVLSIRFPAAIDSAAAAELRRLLGAPADAGADAPEQGEDLEEAVAEDIDPLESSKQHSTQAGGEAYDEDEDSGQGGAPCQQQ